MTDTRNPQRNWRQRLSHWITHNGVWLLSAGIVALPLILQSFDLTRILAVLGTWESGIIGGLILGWALWVEIQSSRLGTGLLVVLRILRFLWVGAALLCLGVFVVGLYLFLLADHAMVLGLSDVSLFTLALPIASVGLCLYVSMLWAWYRLPVAERQRLYEYALHRRSYRLWRQSFFYEYERAPERRPKQAYWRILLKADGSPQNRWLGWAVIPASLVLYVIEPRTDPRPTPASAADRDVAEMGTVEREAHQRMLLSAEVSMGQRGLGWALILAAVVFSATAVSLDLARSSNAHWDGFALIFVAVGYGLAMAASALLPRSQRER